jgi:hypothetical protein
MEKTRDLPLIPPGPIARRAASHTATVNAESNRQGLKPALDANGRRLYTENQAAKIVEGILARRAAAK